VNIINKKISIPIENPFFLYAAITWL
jgi:hypothetical protein